MNKFQMLTARVDQLVALSARLATLAETRPNQVMRMLRLMDKIYKLVEKFNQMVRKIAVENPELHICV